MKEDIKTSILGNDFFKNIRIKFLGKNDLPQTNVENVPEVTLGEKLLTIIDVLKQSGLMVTNSETIYSTEYSVQSFEITMNDKNYTLKHYTETNPHWKDSGPKGDFVYSLLVKEPNTKETIELSAMATLNNPYHILEDNKNISTEAQYKNALQLIDIDNFILKCREHILKNQSLNIATTMQRINGVKNNTTDDNSKQTHKKMTNN